MMRASLKRGLCTQVTSTPQIRITSATSIASEGSPRQRSCSTGLIQPHFSKKRCDAAVSIPSSPATFHRLHTRRRSRIPPLRTNSPAFASPSSPSLPAYHLPLLAASPRIPPSFPRRLSPHTTSLASPLCSAASLSSLIPFPPPLPPPSRLRHHPYLLPPNAPDPPAVHFAAPFSPPDADPHVLPKAPSNHSRRRPGLKRGSMSLAGCEMHKGGPPSLDMSNQNDAPAEQKEGEAEPDESEKLAQGGEDAGYPQMNEKQKKLFELRLKMARKTNQMAMVAEKKRMEAPPESRGISKQKWLEERKKRIGKLLDADGLEMSEAYMLDTQEMAEAKYKKWEKESAPFGWDVYNPKTLYNAYKKRTKNIEPDMEAYNKAKEEDLEFYRNATSLQYGKAPKAPEEDVNRMVKELQDRDAKRKSFSRRRRFHDEKDIDSINDRNEHFNKKIERAFGKYTLEIKNNLERGTALPD